MVVRELKREELVCSQEEECVLLDKRLFTL